MKTLYCLFLTLYLTKSVLFFFFFRLDAPSLQESSTSSSWLPSPGCVLRESSCILCLWRSLRVNIHEKSTIMHLGISSLPLWLASLQLSTTVATGPRKRKCSCLNTFLQMQNKHAGYFSVWVYLLCLSVADFEKKSTHHLCQHPMCIPGDYTKTFKLFFFCVPGMGSCSIFYVI